MTRTGAGCASPSVKGKASSVVHLAVNAYVADMPGRASRPSPAAATTDQGNPATRRISHDCPCDRSSDLPTNLLLIRRLLP